MNSCQHETLSAQQQHSECCIVESFVCCSVLYCVFALILTLVSYIEFLYVISAAGRCCVVLCTVYCGCLPWVDYVFDCLLIVFHCVCMLILCPHCKLISLWDNTVNQIQSKTWRHGFGNKGCTATCLFSRYVSWYRLLHIQTQHKILLRNNLGTIKEC